MNKFITPFGGKTDLGCGHYKYWTQSLNQELHFVDDGNVFDRGDKPLPGSSFLFLKKNPSYQSSGWVEHWENLNGSEILHLDSISNFHV